MSRRTSVDTAGVESRWLGGRLMEAGGFVGSLPPRLSGEQDFAPMLHRAAPETSTSVEPEIDYEGLPQGVATSTHMLAGSVAGIMEHCLMYPIDCVKVSKRMYFKNTHTLLIVKRFQALFLSH